MIDVWEHNSNREYVRMGILVNGEGQNIIVRNVKTNKTSVGIAFRVNISNVINAPIQSLSRKILQKTVLK